MKNLVQWIGKLLFWVMAAALVIYAASRTLDFVNETLGNEDKIIGYLALFATTGGAIAWLMAFLNDARGIAQKGIALVMVIIDVLGEIALFTIDTLMRSGQNGMTTVLTQEEIYATVMGMSLLIGLNIIATFAYHIMDADNMEAMEDHFSEWQIKMAIQKAKREKAAEIANTIAMREAQAYEIEMMEKDRSGKVTTEKNEGFLDKIFKKNTPAPAPVMAETEAVELQKETPQNSFRDETGTGYRDEDGNLHGVDEKKNCVGSYKAVANTTKHKCWQ